ncbi:MAG: hypothetical protein AAFR61_12735 [Bacteroidota bacterium]
MPAKAKYLSSGWVQFSKLMAAIFGCYIASTMLHISFAKSVVDDTPVLLTSAYSFFLVWVGLMIMVYMIKRAWISWAILAGITLIGTGLMIL